MTESEAQKAYYGRLQYESDLRLQAATARAALSTAKGYRSAVVKPGWADAVNSAELTAIGAGLMAGAASATPVGWLGGAIAFVGLSLTGYGLAGSAAYLTQAVAQTFPWIPGASSATGLGERFDAYTPHLPERENAGLDEFAIDHIKGSTLQHYLKKLGAGATAEVPSLPTKVDPFINGLERDLQRLEREIDEIEREQNRKPNIKKATPQHKQGLPPPTGPVLHLRSAQEMRGGRERSDGFGNYAGPDQPNDRVRNTA
ncbi:hypothetical protein QTI51_23015 [Variovorax sp. J22G73]|nr:hypothetical protein [Variovorax sp. J22G73]MDM0100174.1 hypothetical protein [Variovorax sp. J22G73]